MNIEVGEYVRTKKGNIGKVLDITTCTGQKRKKYLIKWNIVKAYYITGTTIVKHSPNIIDLIEVNDIVTYWVDTQSYNGWVQNFVDKELLKDMKENFIEEDIKSIVTHEQIENMEYRV